MPDFVETPILVAAAEGQDRMAGNPLDVRQSNAYRALVIATRVAVLSWGLGVLVVVGEVVLAFSMPWLYFGVVSLWGVAMLAVLSSLALLFLDRNTHGGLKAADFATWWHRRPRSVTAANFRHDLLRLRRPGAS